MKILQKRKQFYAGMLAALAVVKSYDQATLFRAIVDTVDEQELVAVAREDESMEWSGLQKYGYGAVPQARSGQALGEGEK